MVNEHKDAVVFVTFDTGGSTVCGEGRTLYLAMLALNDEVNKAGYEVPSSPEDVKVYIGRPVDPNSLMLDGF